MRFNYKDFEKHFIYLKDPEQFRLLMENQSLVDSFFTKTSGKHAEISRSICLEYLILYQFLDPLIEELEKNPNDEKLNDTITFERELNKLKQLRLKLRSQLQKDNPDKLLSFSDFKGKVNAKLGLDGYSFAFSTPTELQNIIKDMSKIYVKQGPLPCSFAIIPDYSPHSNKSSKDKNREIVENVLTASSEAGLQPEQVDIYINGVKQTPQNNAAYQAWQKVAKEKVETQMKQNYPGFKS